LTSSSKNDLGGSLKSLVIVVVREFLIRSFKVRVC
jgi:hypothetical protein